MSTQSRIISIAPTFACSKRCEGCYLTTGVTKEMRDAELTEANWCNILTVANKLSNYNELAISWNPMPGQEEIVFRIIEHAMSVGYNRINITTTIDNDFAGMANDILQSENVTNDILQYENVTQVKLIMSLSCDDIHGFESLTDFLTLYGKKLFPVDSVIRSATNNPRYLGANDPRLMREEYDWRSHTDTNLNLLWTPGVFKWLFDNPAGFRESFEIATKTFNTVQHLMLKPIGLYGGWDEFIQLYARAFKEHPEICIQGNSDNIIGDASLNSLFGINNCVSLDRQMLDIDPMGNVRICPENPNIILRGDTLHGLEDYEIHTNDTTAHQLLSREGQGKYKRQKKLWRYIEAQWLRHTHTGVLSKDKERGGLLDCSQCKECNCITGVVRDASNLVDPDGVLP